MRPVDGNFERIGDAGKISVQARRSLEMTDNLSPELRACVHEFGTQIVNTLLQHKITDPNKIRAIVHSCWMGAREPHQRHGDKHKSKPSRVTDYLDWLLEQQGAQITAATLLRVLWLNHMTVVPRVASSVMVEASMETVSDYDLKVTKYTKHRMRLEAAIEASARRLWPQLFSAETATEGKPL
jgi:hypothetical protein